MKRNIFYIIAKIWERNTLVYQVVKETLDLNNGIDRCSQNVLDNDLKKYRICSLCYWAVTIVCKEILRYRNLFLIFKAGQHENIKILRIRHWMEWKSYPVVLYITIQIMLAMAVVSIPEVEVILQ